MEHWSTRLARRVLELGWTKVEFARRAGVDVQRVYKYLAGRVERPDDEATIAALARTVGWTPAYLMYGVTASERSEAADHDGGSSMGPIPRIPWGDVGMLTTVASGAKTRKAKSKMPPVPGVDVSDEAFYVDAPDDANVPDIHKGDLLLCDPKRAPVIGRYVIARVGNSEPILAKYTVHSYHKGAPAEIRLAFRSSDNYGEGHIAKVADVHIIGVITHRTSPMI